MMAQFRVRLINSSIDDVKDKIPKIREKLKAANIELQCEPNSFLLILRNKANLKLMTSILQNSGLEFTYLGQGKIDWSNFTPTENCDCRACEAARKFYETSLQKG